MKSCKRSFLKGFIVICLGLTMLLDPLTVFAATDTGQVHTLDFSKPPSRLSGMDQYETAAKIAEGGWSTSEAIVLCSGMEPNLIDAIAAGPLAALLKAPILLTDGSSQLNSHTKDEIIRLRPKKAYITSGQAVIKQDVLKELQEMGVTPVELGGFDQYDTSVGIAQEMESLGAKVSKIAVVAGWVRPADALSIGSIAASQTMPILATEKNELPAKVKDYLNSVENSVTDSFVVGGTAVVSEAIKNNLPGHQQRYAGNTKYDTNLDVLKQCSNDLNFDQVFVANGETLVDALAGVPLAARDSAPIILTNKTLDPKTLDYVKSNLSSKIVALGGEAVVTQDTLNQLSFSVVQSKSDLTMGSIDADRPEEFNDNLLITGDNVNLQNATEIYSIFVVGNNERLANVAIKGTLFIDPGQNGSLSLNNVTASQIVILSGSEEGIHLNNVSAETLKIMSPGRIHIAPTGGSKISSAWVSTDAIIDASQGNWGSVHISKTLSPDVTVELRGTFSHDIFINSEGMVKAAQNTTVAKVVVMPWTDGPISLDGTFDVVQIERYAQLSLKSTAVVNHLVTHVKTDLNVEKGGQVGHLVNGDFGSLTGTGAADLPSADLVDAYPVLDYGNIPTKNPALVITTPQDGAALAYGDVPISWPRAPGAIGYRIDVTDLDPSNYRWQFIQDVSADTFNYTLTTDHLIKGHQYRITVESIAPIDPDVGYGGTISMPSINVTVGQKDILPPLEILSPSNNSSISSSQPVILKWKVPPDAGNNDTQVQIFSPQGGTGGMWLSNGSEIPTFMFRPGKNLITVSIVSGVTALYQGSVEVTFIPTSTLNDHPDVISPVNGTTIDANKPLTVTWKSVVGATMYQVTAAKEGGGGVTMEVGNVTSCQLHPLSDGSYTISVRTTIDGFWRDGEPVTIVSPKAEPVILTPSADSIQPIGDLTVTWKDFWNLQDTWAYNLSITRIATGERVFFQGYPLGSLKTNSVIVPSTSLKPGIYRIYLQGTSSKLDSKGDEVVTSVDESSDFTIK